MDCFPKKEYNIEQELAMACIPVKGTIESNNGIEGMVGSWHFTRDSDHYIATAIPPSKGLSYEQALGLCYTPIPGDNKRRDGRDLILPEGKDDMPEDHLRYFDNQGREFFFNPEDESLDPNNKTSEKYSGDSLRTVSTTKGLSAVISMYHIRSPEALRFFADLVKDG